MQHKTQHKITILCISLTINFYSHNKVDRQSCYCGNQVLYYTLILAYCQYENMTDKQFDKIMKMVSMILDGCKDLEEAKEKVRELSEEQKNSPKE